MEGDPIAGGSVYHLADGWDAGAIAAQDGAVAKGETARELWSARWLRWDLRCWAASYVTLPSMASFPPIHRTRASPPRRRSCTVRCR